MYFQIISFYIIKIKYYNYLILYLLQNTEIWWTLLILG